LTGGAGTQFDAIITSITTGEEKKELIINNQIVFLLYLYYAMAKT